MTEHPQDHQPQHPQQDHQPQHPPQDHRPGEWASANRPPEQPYAGSQSSYQPTRFQPVPMSPADQRTWAVAAHLSAFLAALVALSFLGPLIMYVAFKDRGPFVRRHAAEVLNFQLTMWIGLLISFPLLFVGIGFLTAGAIAIAMLVFQILGAVAASEGRDYRYPLTIRFVS